MKDKPTHTSHSILHLLIKIPAELTSSSEERITSIDDVKHTRAMFDGPNRGVADAASLKLIRLLNDRAFCAASVAINGNSKEAELWQCCLVPRDRVTMDEAICHIT